MEIEQNNILTKEYVYKLYNQFIEQCLLQDNSILTHESGIFSIVNLFKVKTYFLDAAIEGSGPSYWDKIKLQFQNANYEERLCFAHLNWLWYLPANDIKPFTKEETPYLILADEEFKNRFETNKRENYFPTIGIGSAGQYHKTNKPMEINFLLILCILIKQEVEKGTIKTADEVNQFIIDNANIVFENNQFNIPEREFKTLENRIFSMQSLLLHLAKPDYYEAIASQQDKIAIKSNFQN
jgi:5-methylcytosine-specific restriction protein B